MPPSAFLKASLATANRIGTDLWNAATALRTAHAFAPI